MSVPAVGEGVRVRAVWPPGHVRTPAYVRGHIGVVVRVRGAFPDPELLAYGQEAPDRLLFTVRFRHRHLWPAGSGAAEDSVDVDLYEHWLEREAQ